MMTLNNPYAYFQFPVIFTLSKFHVYTLIYPNFVSRSNPLCILTPCNLLFLYLPYQLIILYPPQYSPKKNTLSPQLFNFFGNIHSFLTSLATEKYQTDGLSAEDSVSDSKGTYMTLPFHGIHMVTNMVQKSFYSRTDFTIKLK